MGLYDATVIWTSPKAATERTARRVLFWGLVIFLAAVSPSAAAKHQVTGLLGSLNLSGYPPGERPPQFSSRTAMGRNVSLASLRGRVVLLNFWATWCGECRPEMPVLEQLHRDFAGQGLTVLGINVREEIPTIQRYAEAQGLTFPLVVDPKGEIHVSYGVIGLPTTFMIGRDGRVVARAIGARDWGSAEARALIQALLTEPVG